MFQVFTQWTDFLLQELFKGGNYLFNAGNGRKYSIFFISSFTVTLLGGDFDDFMELSMNGITGGMSGYDALDSTYSPPLSGGYDAPSGDYNAPQTSYNAPQTSYNSPQTSYNAPQNSYNAPQTSYNTPQATYGRLDFGIDPKYQVEVS